MKRCAHCREVKPLDVFGNNASRSDGKSYLCRECDRKRRQSVGGTRLDRAKQNEWRNENRKKYPEKVKAQDRLRTAVKNGTLTRPETCERCGKPEKPQAHHDDYSKWLDVMWLCRFCHRERHAELDTQQVAA